MITERRKQSVKVATIARSSLMLKQDHSIDPLAVAMREARAQTSGSGFSIGDASSFTEGVDESEAAGMEVGGKVRVIKDPDAYCGKLATVISKTEEGEVTIVVDGEDTQRIYMGSDLLIKKHALEAGGGGSSRDLLQVSGSCSASVV
jgi:hypothetical protein